MISFANLAASYLHFTHLERDHAIIHPLNNEKERERERFFSQMEKKKNGGKEEGIKLVYGGI